MVITFVDKLGWVSFSFSRAFLTYNVSVPLETISGFSLAIFFLGCFLFWEKRTPYPMLPLFLFKKLAFSLGSIERFLCFTAQTATVSGGAIDVGSQTKANIIVGLPYTATLAPLYQDIQYRNGTTQGSKKSIQKATIRFKDTLSAKVGQTETDLDPVRFASTTALNTEDAEVWLSNANEFLQTVYVVSDTPQPCTVLAMVVDVEGV